MDIERKFDDLGVDAIAGVRLMDLLNLSPDDFHDPSRFMRFKDVIDHFKSVPDMDYIINKISTGKNVDKLNHVWGYTELSKKRGELSKKRQELAEKIDIYHDLGDRKDRGTLKELQEQLMDIKISDKRVNEQISKYEQ